MWTCCQNTVVGCRARMHTREIRCKPRPVILAVEAVDLRQFCRQLCTIAFAQAPHHVKLPDVTASFRGNLSHNLVDRLFFCIADKSASVYNDNIGVAGLHAACRMFSIKAGISQHGNHALRINKIFRAPEGDYLDCSLFHHVTLSVPDTDSDLRASLRAVG